MLGYRKTKVKGGKWKGGRKLEAKKAGKKLLQQSSHKGSEGLGIERRGLTLPMTSQVRYGHFPQGTLKVA